MSREKLIFYSLILLLVTGCSWIEPFADRRRNAGQPTSRLYVGRSSPDNPVICYNPWVSSYEEVEKLALEECFKYKTGIKVELVDKDAFSCTLFTPAYMKFECLEEGEELVITEDLEAINDENITEYLETVEEFE